MEKQRFSFDIPMAFFSREYTYCSFVLDKSNICAGGQAGTDTCKGDGGGPLMCPSASDPNVYVQVQQQQFPLTETARFFF